MQSEFGWQEYWQYQAEPIDALSAERKFTERIADCINAKWYLLKHTVYTKGSTFTSLLHKTFKRIVVGEGGWVGK